MMGSLQNIFKIPELKRRIIFTGIILIVYRIGGHVPIPGVNPQALLEYFDQAQRGLLGL